MTPVENTMPDPAPASPFAETPPLAPGAVRLAHDSFGKLCLTLDGAPRGAVRPLRALPLSAPHRWIFLLNAEDKEIGLIADTADLDS